MTAAVKLVVISGPSGVGKSTLCGELLRRAEFERVITCTTRSPRDGELQGVDYYFFSEKEFEEKIARQEFLEYARVHDRLYGTLKNEVNRTLNSGRFALLAVDVQGAARLREIEGARDKRATKGFDMVSIFLMPPDDETLRSRLRKRGTEDDGQLELRLRTARNEMEERNRFDRVVVNDDVAVALQEIVEYLTVVANDGEHPDRMFE